MRHKQATWSQRATVLLLCALMVQPWGAYRLMAADITPGYVFSSGEANVTHTKLNNAASGTIATTFYSGKSSAGSSPTPGNYTMIGLDSVSGTYKRATLDAWFFDHSGLLADRTALTAPSAAYTLFVNDGGAYKQLSITNLFFGGTSFTAPSNDTRFGGVVQGGGFGSITYSNLIGSLAAHTLPTNGDFFPLITENGRGVKGMTLESLFKGMTVDTNYAGSNSFLMWGPNGVRQIRGTNFIRGLTLAAPTTNAEIQFLEAGSLQRATLQGVRTLIAANIAQEYVLLRYETTTTPTNGGPLTSGAWRGRILNTNLVDASNLADVPPNIVPLSGTTTSGSAVITSVSSTNNLTPGEHLYAISGLADNTRIVSLDSATQITVSANATASGARNLFRGSVGLVAGTYRFRASAPAYQVGFHQIRLYDLFGARVLGYGTTERSSTGDGTQTRSFASGRFTLTDYAVIELQQQVTTTNGTDGGGDDGAFGTEVYAELELWREIQ